MRAGASASSAWQVAALLCVSFVLLSGVVGARANEAGVPAEEGSTIECKVLVHDEKLECGETEFLKSGEEKLSKLEVVLYAILCILLILGSGLMSGLTIGLISLDKMNLEILTVGGTAKERKYAQVILPVVRQHHLLLVTLLLGNAGCLEALPIFLDRITNPFVAIILSVTAVLFFGEVVPQAICTRWGLAVGANLAWFVKGLMAVLFPITFPIALILDHTLGHDHNEFYRRSHLKLLITMHTAHANTGGVQDDEEGHGPLSGLSHDESTIIRGAIDMKAKTVKDAMTPLRAVFMLDKAAKLDRDLRSEILANGHSRIPVFEGNKQNVVGHLLVKSLIMLDPNVATPIADIPLRNAPTVSSEMPMYDMLNEFQRGVSHLVTVHEGDETSNIVGIITLEDVIEELIQEEIVDETDVYIDIDKKIPRVSSKDQLHDDTIEDDGLDGL